MPMKASRCWDRPGVGATEALSNIDLTPPTYLRRLRVKVGSMGALYFLISGNDE